MRIRLKGSGVRFFPVKTSYTDYVTRSRFKTLSFAWVVVVYAREEF